MFSFAAERQSPSLDDLEKSLQNVNAMLQSAPPKLVSETRFEVYYRGVSGQGVPMVRIPQLRLE